MSRLVDTLTALSQRERRLVGLLMVLVLPLAIVFLVIVPLAERRSAAAQALGEADELYDWVQTNARAYATLPETADAPARVPGLAGLEQSLVTSGLRDRVTALSNRGGGGVEVSFEAVAFDRLMTWLGNLPQSVGYQAAELTVEATENSGMVAARLVLEPGR